MLVNAENACQKIFVQKTKQDWVDEAKRIANRFRPKRVEDIKKMIGELDSSAIMDGLTKEPLLGKLADLKVAALQQEEKRAQEAWSSTASNFMEHMNTCLLYTSDAADDM
eukprot:8745463-Karenia_brevis.AAC.1